MHQREQQRSKHQAQQMENKKEVSKTNQENKSLLTVPDERCIITGVSYKDTLNTQKTTAVTLGDSVPKGINTSLLNKKLIKSKVVCKFFPDLTSKDFVQYTKTNISRQ